MKAHQANILRALQSASWEIWQEKELMFGLESLMGANFFCERNFVRQIMLGDNYVLDYRNIIQNGKDLHDFDRHAVPFFLVALLLRIFYLAVKAKNNTATKSG